MNLCFDAGHGKSNRRPGVYDPGATAGGHEETRLKVLDPGFYPFWFWNADIDESEIRSQIEEMAAQGIRGFFIHSRQGLSVPYLSEAFFRLVGVAVEAARAAGLAVNLYDEYPYPSGVAGGEVILGNPAFQATALVQERYECAGGRVRLALPRGEILCCLACPAPGGRTDWTAAIDCRKDIGMVLGEQSYVETGLTAYNQKRFFASSPTPTLDTILADGAWRIAVSAQMLVTHHKYWGAFVDALNPEAIARFIELTHARYATRFGDELGRTIASVFVDETAPTWSPLLPRMFYEEYGYDLLPLLPALDAEDHPRHVHVTADFERLRYRLFCRAFNEPLAAWCREHGIAWLGEKPSYRLAELRFMDVPGCDAGHTKAGARSDVLQARLRGNARAAASAAYFYGKPRSLCECFHSLGWGATLQDARLIVDELLFAGVDVLVPHAFFYSTHGLRKHDAPPSFFFQMPYWKQWHKLSERVELIARAFAGTWIDAAVLVVDPGSGVPTARGKQLYEQLLARLAEAHLDFLVADTDVLEEGRHESGRLLIRELAAGVIVVPPMRFIEEALDSCLRSFTEAGGRVLRMTEDPDWDSLIGQTALTAEPRLRVSAEIGDASLVRVVSRTDGNRSVHFLLNRSAKPIALRVLTDRELTELPLDPAVPQLLESVGDGYARTLGPFEAALLEGGARKRSAARVGTATIPRVELRVGGPAVVRLLSRNLLRMERWMLALTPNPRFSTAAALPQAEVSAAPLANQIREGHLAFAPEVRTFFGHEPELRMPQLHALYTVEFENRYSGAVELVMEPDSIRGEWRVRVNDGRPSALVDFRPTQAHVRGSLGLDVTADLVQGLNRVTVEVTTDRHDGGLLNPLYLAGDFGVELEPARLVERSSAGSFEDYTANRAPFYAGSVEYELEALLMGSVGAGDILLELAIDQPFEEACEVSLNGHGFRAVPWSPYRLTVPATELRSGTNRVLMRVHTTLIRAFEGHRFDARTHRYVPV